MDFGAFKGILHFSPKAVDTFDDNGWLCPARTQFALFVGASLLANSFRQQAGSYENQFFVISVRPKFMTTRLEALRVSKPLRMNLSVFRVRCSKLVRKRSIKFIGHNSVDNLRQRSPGIFSARFVIA